MFNFSSDKRIMYVILGILVIMNITQYASTEGALLGLLLSLPGVLIAITFHEFAHGIAAYKLGDNTAKNQGRLSLNPLDHLDPVGTFLLVFAGFGWGKPVEVNPRNYTRKVSMEVGQAIVSFAGPLMNFILAIIFSIIYCLIYKFAETEFLISTTGVVVMTLIQMTAVINVGLGVFNLIPLPPLDGSKILLPFLPYNAKQWFSSNEQIFHIIFVVIWITGIASMIISPAIDIVSNAIMLMARFIIGV